MAAGAQKRREPRSGGPFSAGFRSPEHEDRDDQGVVGAEHPSRGTSSPTVRRSEASFHTLSEYFQMLTRPVSRPTLDRRNFCMHRQKIRPRRGSNRSSTSSAWPHGCWACIPQTLRETTSGWACSTDPHNRYHAASTRMKSWNG